MSEGGVDFAAARLQDARRLRVERQSLTQQLRGVEQVAPQLAVGGYLGPARVLHRRLLAKQK